MTTEHLSPEVRAGGRLTDPKTAPLIPVDVEVVFQAAFVEFDNEEVGIREVRPVASRDKTTFRARGWRRADNRIVEYKGTLGEVTLSESDPTDEDLEWLRNIGALPSAEKDFMLERGAVFCSAVGIARLQLQHGDPLAALETLDRACEKTHRLHFDACLADGHRADKVELLLGPRDRPVRRPSLLPTSGRLEQIREVIETLIRGMMSGSLAGRQGGKTLSLVTIELLAEVDRLRLREAYLLERFDGHQSVIADQQRDAFRLLDRVRRNVKRAWIARRRGPS